jgi:hypothetical protein
MFQCMNCHKLKEDRERVHFSLPAKVMFFVISLPLTFGWWLDSVCRDCTLQVYTMLGIVEIFGCAIVAAIIATLIRF